MWVPMPTSAMCKGVECTTSGLFCLFLFENNKSEVASDSPQTHLL